MAARYCTVAEAKQLGLSGRSFEDKVLQTDLGANLDSASREADSALDRQFKLPITAWGDDLKACVAKIAVYEFLSVRGLNPEAGSSDKNVKDRADQARTWLDKVAKGERTPTGIVDSSGDPAPVAGMQPEVDTASQRGWSSRGEPRAGGPFVSD